MICGLCENIFSLAHVGLCENVCSLAQVFKKFCVLGENVFSLAQVFNRSVVSVKMSSV